MILGDTSLGQTQKERLRSFKSQTYVRCKPNIISWEVLTLRQAFRSTSCITTKETFSFVDLAICPLKVVKHACARLTMPPKPRGRGKKYNRQLKCGMNCGKLLFEVLSWLTATLIRKNTETVPVFIKLPKFTCCVIVEELPILRIDWVFSAAFWFDQSPIQVEGGKFLCFFKFTKFCGE